MKYFVYVLWIFECHHHQHHPTYRICKFVLDAKLFTRCILLLLLYSALSTNNSVVSILLIYYWNHKRERTLIFSMVRLLHWQRSLTFSWRNVCWKKYNKNIKIIKIYAEFTWKHLTVLYIVIKCKESGAKGCKLMIKWKWNERLSWNFAS